MYYVLNNNRHLVTNYKTGGYYKGLFIKKLNTDKKFELHYNKFG
jgi:hypothetical protein